MKCLGQVTALMFAASVKFPSMLILMFISVMGPACIVDEATNM